MDHAIVNLASRGCVGNLPDQHSGHEYLFLARNLSQGFTATDSNSLGLCDTSPQAVLDLRLAGASDRHPTILNLCSHNHFPRLIRTSLSSPA